MGRSRRGVLRPSHNAGRSGHRVSGVLPAGSRRSTQGRNSGGQVKLIMIKSDAQRERTEAQVEGFRQALAKVDREMTGKRAVAVRGSCEGMIRQLEDEIREYDELRSGDLALPNVERLDEIAPFITRCESPSVYLKPSSPAGSASVNRSSAVTRKRNIKPWRYLGCRRSSMQSASRRRSL